MMAAPTSNPLGLGRPSTTAADPLAPTLDELTEEQVFGTRKRRYHHAQDVRSPLCPSLRWLDVPSAWLTCTLPCLDGRTTTAAGIQPIESSLNTSQLLLSQSLAQPPPPPPPAPAPAASQPDASTSTAAGRGAVDGPPNGSTAAATARIPVRAKAAKKGKRASPLPLSLPSRPRARLAEVTWRALSRELSLERPCAWILGESSREMRQG